MAKLFADARCSEAILAFLRETEVGLKRRCDGLGWVERYPPQGRTGWRKRSCYVVLFVFV